MLTKAKSKAVVFNYLVNNRYAAGTKAPLRFKGLDPQKKYTVKEVNLYPGTGSVLEGNQVYTGDFLMAVGINPEISSYHTSVVLQLDASELISRYSAQQIVPFVP
jgi:alpha-galactosidase